MAGEKVTDLAEIHIESGVSMFTYEGFISVRALGKNGKALYGQLSAAEARAQGLAFLEAAESAEQDAAVFAATRKLGLADEVAGHIVGAIRTARSDPDDVTPGGSP